MKVMTKFILNRNDQEHYYVEKFDSGNLYHLYLKNKNFLVLNDHNFQAIYGNDQKYSIEDFLSFAILSLVDYLSDDKYRECYDNFYRIYNKIVSSKVKSVPEMGNLITLFLKTMDIYNELSFDFEKVEVPYDENYETIFNSKNKDEENREYVSSITSLNQEYSDLYEPTYHKEVVRTRDYLS